MKSIKSQNNSKSTIGTSASDKSSQSTQRGIDLRSIISGGAAATQERKVRDVYQLDAEGNPTGALLETLLFSDLVKPSLTKNKKNEEIKFMSKYSQPFQKLPSKIDECRKPGSTPIANVFHATSHRERKGKEDDGLEDEDLTAADGIVRKTKVQDRRLSRRRSIVYKNIRLTKGEFSFPHRTYRPKVQVPYRVPLGQVPQAVIIERLHRAYRKTDVYLVLQSIGVELDDLIPPPHYGETNERFYQEMMFRNRVWISGVEKRDYIAKFNLFQAEVEKGQYKTPTHLRHPTSNETLSYPSTVSEESSSESDEDHQHKKKSGDHSTVHPFIKAKPPFGCMFPLDLFDNEEFDIRSGPQWLQLGYDKRQKSNYPLPGKAFLPYAIQDEAEKKTPTFSELTFERILKKSERLDAFRTWLMNMRYRRTLIMSGQDPDKVKGHPSQKEMQALAIATSVVPSLFPNIAFNISEQSSSIALTSALQTLHSSTKKDSLESEESLTVLMKFEEFVAEEEELSSASEIDKHIDIKANMNFLTSELLADHYKKRGSSDSDAGNTDNEVGTIVTDVAKKKLGKDILFRSQSLLSEVFSDASTVKLVTVEEVKSSHSIPSVVDSAVEEEEDETSRRKRRRYKNKQTDKQSIRTADSHIDGDYGFTFPTSPDIDSYDDGFDDIVFDYNKMKKTHTYEWHWVDVAVFDYNEDTRKYLVRSIYSPYIFAWVGKLYLCFDGEDPICHGERIRDAVIRRFEFENIMRYNLYVDCLPINSFSGTPRQSMKSIVNKTMSATRQQKNNITDKMKLKIRQELDLVYKKIHAQMKFEHIVQRHPKIYKPWLKVPEKDTNYEPLNLWDVVTPRYLGKNHFMYKVSKIAKRSVLFTSEPYRALRNVVGFCQDALQKSFITLDLGDPFHIEDYKKFQEENMDHLLLYLKGEWFESILQAIRAELLKIPNSWYALKELRWDIYMMSKVSKYLNVVHFLMSDTVRTMVLDSLRSFVNRIKDMAITCEGRTNFPWGNNLTESLYPAPSGYRPLLLLELHLDENGPKYTVPLHTHCEIFEELVSKVIRTATSIPYLLPLILPQHLFGTKGILCEMFDDDPQIQLLQSELVHYLRLALRPVDSYAQKYRKYQYTVDTDATAFLREWNTENRTASEVKKVVEQLRQHIQMFDDELPATIDITAFRVVVDVVKQGLIKKKSQLITAILDNFAQQLKAAVTKVKEDYDEIERKLMTRSEDIEEVIELKTYLEMVPANINRIEDVMQKILKDYELFERFTYTIKNEDSDLKWTVALHNCKASRMAHDAGTWLDEDYDRLLKTHQQDLSIFSDQVDSSTLAVGGLVAFIELEKAVDVAAEVKKVWLTIKDLFEQSVILNKRQAVFGMPPLSNYSLDRLIKDIEPFKNLWFVASDWVKARDSVYKDVLDKIDLHSLTNVIQEGETIIKKCVKYFAGADTIQHIAKEILHQIKTFKSIVPLLQTLKNPGMRQRHWEAISERCGFLVVARGSESFKKLLDRGIEEHVDFIAKVGVNASKEYEIEAALDNMEKNLRKYYLRIIEDEETGVIIAVLSDDAIDAVTQFMAKTNEISESPFRGTFEERIGLWERRIHMLKHNIEMWFESQHNWLEIQPIFATPDIAKKMPQEYKLFQSMDWIWRRLVRRARNASELQELATDCTIVSGLSSFNNHLRKLHNVLEERKNMQEKGSDSDD